MGWVRILIASLSIVFASQVASAETLSETSVCRAFIKILEASINLHAIKPTKAELLNQLPSLPSDFQTAALEFFNNSTDDIEFYSIENPKSAKLLLQLWADASPETAKEIIQNPQANNQSKPVFFTPSVLLTSSLLVFSPAISAIIFGQHSLVTQYITLGSLLGGITYSGYLLNKAIRIENQSKQSGSATPTTEADIQKAIAHAEYLARDLFVEALTSEMSSPHLRQFESSRDQAKAFIVLDSTPESPVRLRAWIKKKSAFK